MLQWIREAGQMPRNRDDEYTQNIRDALLGDPQLMRLLGGTHVFEDAEFHPTAPHITIGQSRLRDWSAGREIKGQRAVSLQVWSNTGKKELAQKLLDTAHQALEAAGLMGGNSPIQLKPEYSGSRQVPESKEVHGILRYHAVRQGEAA